MQNTTQRPAPQAAEEARAPHERMPPDRPSFLQAGAWWPIVKTVALRIGDDRVMAEAASVTYYALLAVFPALAALISLYGMVADPAAIGSNVSTLQGIVPDGGMQILNDQIHSLTATPSKSLGLGAIIGLLISIWSANAGVKSLFDALNAVYEERESRSFLHRTWLSLLFTLGALVFVMLALGAVVVLPAALNFIGFQSLAATTLAILRWPLLLATFLVFLAVIYRYGPSRKTHVEWRWITWGSVFSAVAWVSGSALFSWYVANFGSYNKTYGSLGAAVGFMTWIWISTTIVLIGAELNAEIERRANPPRARPTVVAGKAVPAT